MTATALSGQEGQGHRRAIEHYIAAKDFNRPYLMATAFARDAALEMHVETEAISFPSAASGIEAITDVLVRRFAQTYENVHTFCIAAPPLDTAPVFTCDWLVGMSEKESGRPRVGCGRYEWTFREQAPRLVQKLSITIRHMQQLAPTQLVHVMEWLSSLPYPWCARATALASAPHFDELSPVREYLGSPP